MLVKDFGPDLPFQLGLGDICQLPLVNGLVFVIGDLRGALVIVLLGLIERDISGAIRNVDLLILLIVIPDVVLFAGLLLFLLLIVDDVFDVGGKLGDLLLQFFGDDVLQARNVGSLAHRQGDVNQEAEHKVVEVVGGQGVQVGGKIRDDPHREALGDVAQEAHC